MKQLNENFLYILNKIKDYNFYVAGGAIAASYFEIYDSNQDLDIFFRTENNFRKLDRYFQNSNLFYEVANTQNAVTYEAKEFSKFNTVQLICRNFGEPEQIISNFDINKCMIALDIHNKKLHVDNRFYEPMKVYRYHVGTLSRVAKYAYRSKEDYDWSEIIELFYKDVLMIDYYNNTKRTSRKFLRSFLRTYLTSETIKDAVRTKITEALSKYVHDFEMMNFLSTVSVPYDLHTDDLMLQILFCKCFSKSKFGDVRNSSSGVIGINQKTSQRTNKLLKKYFKNITKNAPEVLF